MGCIHKHKTHHACFGGLSAISIVICLSLLRVVQEVGALSLGQQQPPFQATATATATATSTATAASTSVILPVAQVHRRYADLPEGKHTSQRTSINVVVEDVKQTSPRLVFLRTLDANKHNDNYSMDGNKSDNNKNNDNNDDDDSSNRIELLLRERDSFLSCSEIDQIRLAVSQPGATLQCQGYPEKLSSFDGPSFFPQLLPVTPLSGVCLHVTAANVTLATGEILTICPHEKRTTTTTTTTAAQSPSSSTTSSNIMDSSMVVGNTLPPGRMPQKRQELVGDDDGTSISKNNRIRWGGRNRDRGGIFAAWAIDTFGLSSPPSSLQNGGNITRILDIAGGSGQLAFQLGVRRGYNITVVDPRPLRLSSDQQKTLQFHREKGLRLLPDGRDVSKAASDYGHHFCELLPAASLSSSSSSSPSATTTTTTTTEQQGERIIVIGKSDDLVTATTHGSNTNNNQRAIISDRTWLVGGGAHVRHLAAWFDPSFVIDDDSNHHPNTAEIWRDASVVLGMHPDEATEDIVDLCLAYGKPFAVVPCCVFWKRDPQRTTPSTGKSVRTHEQFCEYLAAKDDQRIQIATLPFPGRNTVLYSMGGLS